MNILQYAHTPGFRIRQDGKKWEIIKQESWYTRQAYIFTGIFPGDDTPKFDTKKEAKTWLKKYIGILI